MRPAFSDVKFKDCIRVGVYLPPRLAKKLRAERNQSQTAVLALTAYFEALEYAQARNGKKK